MLRTRHRLVEGYPLHLHMMHFSRESSDTVVRYKFFKSYISNILGALNVFQGKNMNCGCVLEYEISSNRILLVEDIPLLLKYNDKIKLYMYSV